MPSKSFRPTRVRKRKARAREDAQPQSSLTLPSPSDSNASMITASKAEREARKQALREELKSQQPKISSRKQKRLDKYIDKKLKKDESADLVRKLEREKEKYTVTGLQSSKALKRKFSDYVGGQLRQQSAQENFGSENIVPKQQRKDKKPDYEDDEDSVDSFEEHNEHAFDPTNAPAIDIAADAWLKQKAPPVQAAGLAQPLQTGANGMPLIPTRKRKILEVETQPIEGEQSLSEEPARNSDENADDEPWEGFTNVTDESTTDPEHDCEDESKGDNEGAIDTRLQNIDGDVLDALLAELERSDESEIEDDQDTRQAAEAQNMASEVAVDTPDDASTSSDDSDVRSRDESDSEGSSSTSDTSKEDVVIKPRTSAFKSWATQQLNQSIGHTPFYELSQNNVQTAPSNEVFEKPAAGFRLGVQETERPKDDRRAYTVHVDRPESIQETRIQLPILQREQEIMEAVHNNPVVVIKGDTGSGKTTQIPQFLFEAGFGDKKSSTAGMIGITQPRRVAAVSMAKRVAEELGNHADKVAHQIRFDTTVSSRTAVKFMTDGILLRELSQDLLLKKYSAIIVDEAHERSVNTDLLIGMLSKIVPARMKKTAANPDPTPLKLIIMSATLNISDFLHERLFPAGMKPPVVEVEGRQHKVTTHFALRSRADYIDETIEKVKRAHRKLPKGGLLVFLTGQNEIKHVLSRLRIDLVRSAKAAEETKLPRMRISAAEVPLELDDLDIDYAERTHTLDDQHDDFDIITDETELDKEFEVSDGEDEDAAATGGPPNSISLSKDPYDTVHLLPLYSQLPTKEQLRIFDPPPDRARLIVLATNVAETSLTIPGIRYVLDCGRSKERKFNAETAVQSFEIDYISKSSAQQRAGRAGRTGPGHCWRLYSSAVYEQFFPDHTEPEILRTPAESVVLQLKSFRYPRPVADFPFPSSPTHSLLEKAELLLRNLGAISGPTGTTTEIGKKLALYPLSPRLGKILVQAIAQPRILVEILALTAALSVDDVFVNQTQVATTEENNEEGGNVKQQYSRAHAAFSKHDKTSDALKSLTAIQMYTNAVDKESFCQQHFVRPKVMHEIAQLFAQLRSMVQANHPEFTQNLSNVQPRDKLKTDVVKIINTTLASGYIDQIALRYDMHPTPPALLTRPMRAIDVPYLPLTPLSTTTGSNSTIMDRAVFVHPSSVLSRLSTKALPEYIVYRHLQTSQPQTVTSTDGSVLQTKTRMLPLCPIDGVTLLSLIRETSLIEYGKPIPKTKIEDVPNTRPKERVCWVGTEIKQGSAGSFGWPLPPTKVRQAMDLKAPSGWRVVDVLA